MLHLYRFGKRGTGTKVIVDGRVYLHTTSRRKQQLCFALLCPSRCVFVIILHAAHRVCTSNYKNCFCIAHQGLFASF